MIDDLDRVMAVMEAAFEPRWGEAWTRRQVADSLLFPHTHVRLCSIEGRISGSLADDAAGFTLVRSAPGEEELLLVAVHPDMRCQGFGAALLNDALHQARLRGADSMFLEMRTNNPARQLYERHGFRPIGKRPAYYRLSDGSRIDAITFGCDIPK